MIRKYPPFFDLARHYPVQLRFIEYMPIDSHDKDWQSKYLSLETVKTEAEKLGYPLTPLEGENCSGPAEMYHMPGRGGTVGLIPPHQRAIFARNATACG